ncbi:MAG: acetate--CoA ligase [Chlamydiae bacterium]|nr:acetate--CoA ligase [Chlamydiota bacterium]MBI3265819.1 acetate--CoA ligase [Chlamydiota bacterium]
MLKQTHALKEDAVFYPPQALSEKAYIKNLKEYERLYEQSIKDPENFWAREAQEHLSWFEKWDPVMAYDFKTIGQREAPYCQFFVGGKLNASYNCLDRHVSTWKKNKKALVWVGEKEGERRTLTYQELYEEVCRFANVLKKNGVGRGDRVTLFMPMVPELAIAVLACARMGAIHSVVFSAFSAESLKGRILDCDSKVVVTCDVGFHGGKVIDLKGKVDEALKECPGVQKVLVFRRGKGDCLMKLGRDLGWHEEMRRSDIHPVCPPEKMDSEDPLFILYTSGSTGKPKGVLHTTAGYLLYVHLTFKWIFDVKDKDLFWCTADIGWITGHSYVIYGPLSNGATVLMFEGIPTYPEPDRFWKIIADEKVSIFYTAPTAIRALMRLGDEWPHKHDLSSLRILGSVGEPINPAAWLWYYRVIGKERCPVLDTWWQTETGGIMIAPLAGAIPMKPGSTSKPFFGIVPEVFRADGTKASADEKGSLVITRPWPGMLRGVYGDSKNEGIQKIYFSQFPGNYFTGDGCKIDEDGFYWLQGRIDDVINVSGHRISTAEVEHVLVSHEAVAETAVVGFPHEIKGQGIYCFVTLKKGFSPSEKLEKELISHVRKEISPIAKPDQIQFNEGLPKTRSGKIMRRILRKIAQGDIGNLGDTSTLADPSVVDTLVKGRKL